MRSIFGSLCVLRSNKIQIFKAQKNSSIPGPFPLACAHSRMQIMMFSCFFFKELNCSKQALTGTDNRESVCSIIMVFKSHCFDRQLVSLEYIVTGAMIHQIVRKKSPNCFVVCISPFRVNAMVYATDTRF